MKQRDVATLISYTYVKNIYGVRTKSLSLKKDVIVDVESVTGSEFFQGGATGIRPELRFTIFDGDYDGQEVVEYKGTLYSIYRTYRNEKFYLELYAERRKGDE